MLGRLMINSCYENLCFFSFPPYYLLEINQNLKVFNFRRCVRMRQYFAAVHCNFFTCVIFLDHTSVRELCGSRRTKLYSQICG